LSQKFMLYCLGLAFGLMVANYTLEWLFKRRRLKRNLKLAFEHSGDMFEYWGKCGLVRIVFNASSREELEEMVKNALFLAVSCSSRDWEELDGKGKFSEFIRTLLALNRLYASGMVTAPGAGIIVLDEERFREEFPEIIKEYGDPSSEIWYNPRWWGCSQP